MKDAKHYEWLDRNSYYHRELTSLFTFHVEKGKAVLEIGIGAGAVLDACQPSRGVGVTIPTEKSPNAENVCAEARKRFPQYEFYQWAGESALPEAIRKAFPNGVDYILLVNACGFWQDIQKALSQLKSICHPGTRIISTHYNILWSPFLRLAEFLHLKTPRPALNWLSPDDVANFFNISGHRVLKQGFRSIVPINLGPISTLLNRIVPHIPILGHLRITNFTIARPEATVRREEVVASVIIPARNEAGNIEAAVRRMAAVAENAVEKYEIVFVEGNSTDHTAKEIQRVMNDSSIPKPFPVSFYQQTGKGKGDAVRLGFAKAKGNLFLILDADLTVPPEDVPKFIDVYCDGSGEFINGSRLLYKMEKAAMRPLNLIGNKFFSLAFTWLLSQRFKDTLCGTKVVSRANYERIAAGRVYFGDFDPFGDFDLIFGASKLDLEIAEVPIRYRERIYGETNISRWKHGWLLLKMCVYAMGKIKFVP